MVNPNLIMTSILSSTKGSTSPLTSTSLRWIIPELGVTTVENAVLEFLGRIIQLDAP